MKIINVHEIGEVNNSSFFLNHYDVGTIDLYYFSNINVPVKYVYKKISEREFYCWHRHMFFKIRYHSHKIETEKHLK